MLFCKLSHKNLLTELAPKPVITVMQYAKEKHYSTILKELQEHQTQEFILKQFNKMLRGLQHK